MTSENHFDGVRAVVRDWRFEPGRDTGLAVATLLVFWPIYYLGDAHWSIPTAAIWFLAIVGVCVLGPAYYVICHRGEGLYAVGITSDGWVRALGLSVFLAGLFGLEFVFDPPGTSSDAFILHILTVAFMLWEPFFVHGWLQLRFEDAFGPLPGVLLAAGGFGLYNVGVLSPTMLGVLVVIGIFNGLIFLFANRNLLVLWPVYWAVTGTQGTIDRVVFDQFDLAVHALALLVTAIGLLLIERNHRGA